MFFFSSIVFYNEAQQRFTIWQVAVFEVRSYPPLKKLKRAAIPKFTAIPAICYIVC